MGMKDTECDRGSKDPEIPQIPREDVGEVRNPTAGQVLGWKNGGKRNDHPKCLMLSIHTAGRYCSDTYQSWDIS